MSWKTWSPFQSPEVREICQNLTPAEEQRLMEAASANGAQIGRMLAPVCFGAAAAGSGVFVALGFRVTILNIALIVLALGLMFGSIMLFLPPVRAMRRRSIDILCATEFARRKGYTPENIRLHAFDWSRRAEPGNESPQQFDRRTGKH